MAGHYKQAEGQTGLATGFCRYIGAVDGSVGKGVLFPGNKRSVLKERKDTGDF